MRPRRRRPGGRCGPPMGGISSLALGLSGPPIGGISSWHPGLGHRWRMDDLPDASCQHGVCPSERCRKNSARHKMLDGYPRNCLPHRPKNDFHACTYLLESLHMNYRRPLCNAYQSRHMMLDSRDPSLCEALEIQVYVNGHSSHRCVVADAKKGRKSMHLM